MKVQIYGKNITVTPAIAEKIEKKLNHLEKYFIIDCLLYTSFCGGRAAEELIFHSITSGAANDIEQATKIARSMITRLGMSEQFGMTALETVNNRYLGQDATLACSDQTATKITSTGILWTNV